MMFRPLTSDPWLLGVCVARILLYADFMVYAACLAVVRLEWQISAAQAALVSTGFTVAYALSLVCSSALADRIGARRVVVWSAWLAGASALVFGLFARSYVSALVLYTLVGATQGGVYTPVIMLMADRYAPAERGAAVGWLIASTSIGYAGSLVLTGFALVRGGYGAAFLVAGVLPAIGAAVLTTVLRGTPNQMHERRQGVGVATVLRERPEARRLIAGYTGHSWELLGMWAWMPAFLTATLSRGGATTVDVADASAYVAAGLHLLGATAAMTLGRLSDRVGRRRVLVAIAATSTALSFGIGWAIAGPVWLVVGLAVAYSFTALGDSPVLSTTLTETIGPGYLGSILGVWSLCGFGAGAVAPWVFGLVLDASNSGSSTPALWGWAFSVLGLGGAVATVSVWSFTARE